MTMCSFPGNRSKADTTRAARPAGPDSSCPPTVHPAQVQRGHQGGWGGVWRMRDRMSEHSPRAEESQCGRSPASPGPAGRSELPPHGAHLLLRTSPAGSAPQRIPQALASEALDLHLLEGSRGSQIRNGGTPCWLRRISPRPGVGSSRCPEQRQGCAWFFTAGVSLLWSRAVPGPACPGLFPGHLLQPRRRAQW